MDEDLRTARRAAESAPMDAAARVAHARALLHAGLRAAAAHELAAAALLGVEAPDLGRALTFEKPAGTAWTIECPPPSVAAVAPALDDARTRSARARHDETTLPLVLVLGGLCDRCDDEATVCAKCRGTGLCPDSLDNYHYDPYCMAPCPHDGGSMKCGDCRGTKFKVSRRGSPCGHGSYDEEGLAGLDLERCRSCGLVALRGESPAFACAVCGLLDCGCGSPRTDR